MTCESLPSACVYWWIQISLRCFFNEVDTEPKVVTGIIFYYYVWGVRVVVRIRVGVRVGVRVNYLGTLSLYYYAHSITPC